MLALDGGAIDERALRTMADALVHRGPDSEGLLVDGPAGLAARRLAIIDLARGDQPMANEDRTVHVVQNGELYARPAPVDAEAVRRDGGAALAAELRARLRDSVRAHLEADVPVGVFLSGGIDSSLLAALAAQESPGAVRTFSIGFEERSFDELSRARAVARRYATDHHELVLRPDAAALLPRIAAAFDEPFADSSALPTYAVSLARRVVGRRPSSSRRVSLEYKAKRFVRAAARPPLERHHGWKEIFSPEARAALVEPARRVAGADALAGWRARYAETAGAEPLARLQDVDIGTYLVDDLLVKTDRASMAHSLEVRVPFLDPVVAEPAFALPTSHKVLALAKKRLLRRAAAGLVPRAIVHGPKRGFSIPAAAWLRGDLRPFARDMLAPDALRRDGFFRPDAVTRLLDEHESGREDHSRPLWGLLCFQLWRQTAAGGAR